MQCFTDEFDAILPGTVTNADGLRRSVNIPLEPIHIDVESVFYTVRKTDVY